MSDLPGTVVQVVGVGRPTPVSTTARRLNHNQRLFNQRSPPHLLQHGPPPAATAEGAALILSK